MPAGVDRRIRSVMNQRNVSRESAIRILKASNVLKQKGSGLALGSNAKRKKKKK